MRLLQLVSPTLPVGAYTYSQGLEWAVEHGEVHDAASAQAWILDLLHANIAGFEAPWLAQLLADWDGADDTLLAVHDARYLASRETAELRAETLQMGHSLRRLLIGLQDFPAGHARRLRALATPSYLLAWACAASAWQLPAAEALQGYLWAWAENQTLAALKAVPLGQSDGQQMLAAFGRAIPGLAAAALTTGLDAASNFAPGFAIACARHETQYTRLFRS